MPFKYYEAPTIAERVALGREINRLEDNAIIPFPSTWDPSMLMETFRTGGAGAIYALQNKGFQRGALHLYPDEEGNWIYGALRMDHLTEVKQVLPLRATRVSGLNPGLEAKAIDAPRPLYGLDILASRPDAPVIVVEGEKAADAGRIRFPDHVVVTWPGGAQGLGQVDLRPLAGRDVTIWPDHDKTGRDAAELLAGLLTDIGVAQLRIVLVPPHFPPKWDVADAIPGPAHA
jgi:hypothetical protein